MKKDKFMSKVQRLSKKAVCVLATALMCTNSLFADGVPVFAKIDTDGAYTIKQGTDGGKRWSELDLNVNGDPTHRYSSYESSKEKALRVDASYGFQLQRTPNTKISVEKGESCSAPSTYNGTDLEYASDVGLNGKYYRWFKTSDNEANDIQIKISNLRIYQCNEDGSNGRWVTVDLVRTVTGISKYKGQNGYVALGDGLTNAAYIGITEMTVKSQFYKAGTSTPVTLKSNVTLNDIDACQYIGIDADRMDGHYVSSDTHLKYKQIDSGMSIYAETENELAESDAWSAAAFIFTGNSLTYKFGRMDERPGSATEGPTNLQQYVGTGQAMTRFNPPNPVKTVTNDSNDKETDVKEVHIRDLGKTWTYTVEQAVPSNMPENFYYNGFAFEDKIEECMKILDVKVLAEDSNSESINVSGMFDISTAGNKVTAALKNPKSAAFYENTVYKLQIRVRMNVPENPTEEQLNALRETWTTHGHYNETKTVLTENNSAKTIIDGENKVTNEVKTLIELSEMTPPGETSQPGLRITKDVNRYENEVGDIMKYTVKVSNTNKDADTAYFIIKDTTLPDSFALDFSSVKITGIDAENYTLTQSGNGWILKSNGDYALPYGAEITITYEAKALAASNGTCVDNTASAIAAGIPEKTDKEQVYINSPKVDVVKTTPDTKHKVGDTVGYKTEISNRNPGTFMRDIVLNDLVKTEGLEIKEGTVAVLVSGKDVTDAMEITYSEDGKGFTIQTPYNLKNGDIPCIGMEPYQSITNWTDKITVTYDATITDEAAEETELENVFSAPATKNTNGDVIKDDPEIPSGGGEDTEDVTMKAAALNITKKSDKQQYQVGETGKYTLAVTETKEECTAKNVTVTDAFVQEEGMTYDAESLAVSFNGEDITKDCTITVNQRDFKIETGKNMSDEDKLEITYHVNFTKTGEYTNTAVAASDNTKEDQANNVVEVKEAAPDMEIEKASDKTEYVEGETGKYTLKITQKNADATAKNVIVKDYFKQADGLEIQKDTLKVAFNGEDITKDCKTAVNTNDFYIETGKDMTSKDTMTVTYDVLFTKTGTYENKAAALAENAGEKQDNNTVKVVKSDVEMTKDADKKTYKEGDLVNYTVSVALKKEGAKAKNVIIKDTIPEGLELQEDSVAVQGVKGYAADVKGNTLTVTIPEMSYGEKAVVSYKAKVLKSALGKKLTNKATVNGDGINGGQASVTVEVPKPDNTTPGSNGSGTSTPKTGDDRNMAPYAAVIAAAGIAAVVVLVKKKKLKK